MGRPGIHPVELYPDKTEAAQGREGHSVTKPHGCPVIKKENVVSNGDHNNPAHDRVRFIIFCIFPTIFLSHLRSNEEKIMENIPCITKVAITLFLVAMVGSAPPAEAGSATVKLSKSGICHDQESRWYGRTKNFTPYETLRRCLADGGRLPSGDPRDADRILAGRSDTAASG